MSMLDPSAKLVAIELIEDTDDLVREYAKTLLRYGELCADGKEDTVTGDVVGRKLDRLWLAMTQDQHDRINKRIEGCRP